MQSIHVLIQTGARITYTCMHVHNMGACRNSCYVAVTAGRNYATPPPLLHCSGGCGGGADLGLGASAIIPPLLKPLPSVAWAWRGSGVGAKGETREDAAAVNARLGKQPCYTQRGFGRTCLLTSVLHVTRVRRSVEHNCARLRSLSQVQASVYKHRRSMCRKKTEYLSECIT